MIVTVILSYSLSFWKRKRSFFVLNSPMLHNVAFFLPSINFSHTSSILSSPHSHYLHARDRVSHIKKFKMPLACMQLGKESKGSRLPQQVLLAWSGIAFLGRPSFTIPSSFLHNPSTVSSHE